MLLPPALMDGLSLQRQLPPPARPRALARKESGGAAVVCRGTHFLDLVLDVTRRRRGHQEETCF